MSKAQLRNALEKRFADRPNICVPQQVYQHKQFDVVLIDVLTRLHSITENRKATPFAQQNVVRDGASLVTSLARQFDWYFSRGARVVVNMLDKAQHVPVTKGVEQRRRNNDSDTDMHNIEHEDPVVARNAERRLLQRAQHLPGMTALQKKRCTSVRNKIDKYNQSRSDLEDTYGRLTILELDDLRGCWERLPFEKRRELLLQMRDHGMALRVRDPATGELAILSEERDLNDMSNLKVQLDDYQLESVLLSVVRNQSLPRPWELMIRSTSSEHGARAKIVRYLVRSLIHGYYDAYTPQPGARIYIDGHDTPGWQIAKSNVFTRLPDDYEAGAEGGAILELDVERLDPGSGVRTSAKKRVRRVYENTSPLELKSPHDQNVYVTPAGAATDVPASAEADTESSHGRGTLRLHEPHVYANEQNHMRGNTPNASQPQVRYAKEFANRIGEADFSAFTWIERLRKKHEGPQPGETAVQYDSFEIVSCDSDLFYYTLLYIHKLRARQQPTINITLTMDTGWRPTKRVFDMNCMYDAIVHEMLDGDSNALVSLLVALYASAGDYVVGYKFVTPETFTTAYLEHRAFIGPLVHTIREGTPDEQMMLSGDAYRRLLQVAYFMARAKVYGGKLGVESPDEVRDLAQLRELLNMMVVTQPKDRKLFRSKKPTNELIRIPQYGGDFASERAQDRINAEQFDYDFGLFVTRLQKKIPNDEEITRRGLLLQYFIGMLSQIGTAALELPNPLHFGYALIDASKPLSRRNIHFDACYKYELFDYLQRRVDCDGIDALSPTERRLHVRCSPDA